MFIQILVTAFLILCSVSVFLTSVGRVMPVMCLIPLIAAVIYWLVIILHNKSGKTETAGKILLVIFYLFLIDIIPTVVMEWLGDIGDREKNIPAITIGNGPREKTIFIIYHSGVTPFTTDTITKFAEMIGKDGFKTVLYSANKDLKIDLNGAAAVGISSPIYLNRIRPPVENFIMNNDLKSIKTFLLLTSGGDSDRGELKTTASEIEKKGASVIGMEKIGRTEKQDRVDAKLNKLEQDIENAIK